MKTAAILLISFLSLAMAQQPWVETNRYVTLGYNVIEYSREYEKAYQIFTPTGELVAECDLAGFVEWKKRRLMELIGQPSTSDLERQQYTLQYEELSRRQDAANNFLFNALLARRQANQQTFQNQSSTVFQNARDRSNSIYESWRN